MQNSKAIDAFEFSRYFEKKLTKGGQSIGVG